MSDKYVTVLKRLLPKGLLNAFKGSYLEKLFDGFSLSFQRLEDYLNGVGGEAIPQYCENMVDEWADIYNINQNLTDEEKKQIAGSYYTGTGGQSEAYIEEQIKKSFPDADLETVYNGSAVCGNMICGGYNAICGGNGSVLTITATATADQEEELVRLVEYYAPKHLTRVYNITP